MSDLSIFLTVYIFDGIGHVMLQVRTLKVKTDIVKDMWLLSVYSKSMLYNLQKSALIRWVLFKFPILSSLKIFQLPIQTKKDPRYCNKIYIHLSGLKLLLSGSNLHFGLTFFAASSITNQDGAMSCDWWL